MSDYILYHNPRWGKSREAVSLLNENNINYVLVEYLKNPLSVTEVMSLSSKLGLAPGEFVRKSEKEISSHIDNITLLIDKANFLFLDLSIKKKLIRFNYLVKLRNLRI